MKKLYLIILIIGMTCFFAHAQKGSVSGISAAKKSPHGQSITINHAKGTKSVLWSEDFEVWPPANLTVSSGSSSTASGIELWHQTDGAAEVNYDDGSMSDEWMISDPIILPTAELILKFDWFGSYYWHVDPSDGADVSVKVSTDGGTNWTTIWVDDNQAMVEAGGNVWPWVNWTPYTAELDISSYAGTEILLGFHYLGNDGAQWQFDNIIIEDIVAFDCAITNITVPPVLGTGARDITGVVQNMGTTAITGFDVVYTIDGTSVSSVYTVSGVNIAYGQTYAFVHDVQYDFASIGTYNVEVAISNINGIGDDENLANNVLDIDVEAAEGVVQRRVLHEVLTSSSCAPCAETNPVIDGVVFDDANIPYSTVVKYQVSWPGEGDPYQTPMAADRVT
ncbi:MAG: choice-of-anchor J domain-containing protein [Bacteroidales bacterium]|nr:choice-of-anchor J domain-containing protein [Bacteroidales bacterium]